MLGSCVLSVYLLMEAPDGVPPLASGGAVALIHIDGVIAGTGSVYEGYITPEYLLDQLDQALDDPDVAAIVLRIDSPGGTVAASWEISEAVRRASQEKPVIASIGDVGASGAYMVASQCDTIIATPGSSVGSIGVIMEIPNVEGLLDKLGVEFTTLTSGELKDAGSPYRSMTETETALFQAQMTQAYDQFIIDVARGRGMPESEVRELATGWVWLGDEALDKGLIDEIGTFDDAIATAGELGGIEGDPYITTYEQIDPFEGLLFDMIGLLAPARGLDAESIERSGLPR
jgi:protease-4